MTADTTNRKRVIFVDDDGPFLEVLQAYMERLSDGGWEVLGASDSSHALGLLANRTVDLAVLDVRMPVVDGVQLLHLLNRKHPQLKKAVLSGYLDDECRSLAFNGGAELVLEKPADAPGYEALYSALNELLHLPAEQGFRGMLQSVGLADVIQMKCLSRHSLILEVTASGRRGCIYIRTGALIHAECGGVTGESALQQLLTLAGGEFRNLPFAEPPRETLEGSWEFLLLEAVRLRDEAAGAETSSDLQTPTEVIIAPAPTPVTSAPVERAEETPVIRELVVFSNAGEVLFETGSPDARARGQLCIDAAAGAARVESLLPIGTLERIEFLSERGRVIARFQDGQAVFLRANDET